MPYGLPKRTIYDKQVPKKYFIDLLGANPRIKRLFTSDIETITWLAKFTSDTLNVSEGKSVEEITVFHVKLKKMDVSDDIFSFIDSRLPRHTLFILEFDEKTCLHISYKERTESNSANKYRIINTYHTPWTKTNEMNISLFGLSMDSIYETLVRQVAGRDIIVEDDDLSVAIVKTKEYEALSKEIDSLKKKIKNECQPNKKYQLHTQLTELRNKRKQYKITK